MLENQKTRTLRFDTKAFLEGMKTLRAFGKEHHQHWMTVFPQNTTSFTADALPSPEGQRESCKILALHAAKQLCRHLREAHENTHPLVKERHLKHALFAMEDLKVLTPQFPRFLTVASKGEIQQALKPAQSLIQSLLEEACKKGTPPNSQEGACLLKIHSGLKTIPQSPEGEPDAGQQLR